MKKTISAIKYGIDTLKVTPNAMFSLLESSKGYEGEDYQRWLANKIISIAEEDGIGFSQLLVKKFAIISAIIENSNSLIKEEWVQAIKNTLQGKIYSINFPEISEVVDIKDWYEGLDYLGSKEFSESELMGCGLYSDLVEVNEVSLLGILSDEPVKKGNSLALSAKELGIQCKNLGSLLLYRMCNLADAWELGENFHFTFMCKTSFLYDRENADIIKYFLSYFDYKGFVVNASDLYEEGYDEDDYAFISCTSSTEGTKKDCFMLSEGTILGDGGIGLYLEDALRYSRTDTLGKDSVAFASTTGTELSDWAYIKNTYGNISICDSVTDMSDTIIVNEGNYKEALAYYGTVLSLMQGGMSVNIRGMLTGSADFEKLYFNCLPLALFSENSYLANNGSLGVSGDFMSTELERGEVYYSYEAKELISVCKGFLEFMDEDSSVSFSELRKSANHAGLNEAYLSALRGLKDYVRSFYKANIE